jgi:hypothetical protein
VRLAISCRRPSRRSKTSTGEFSRLSPSSWHTCNTTHCRAGWVVHLAGEAGYALERLHNTALAAQLIYEAIGYKISPVRFYDGNEDALADMAKLAGAETEAAE